MSRIKIQFPPKKVFETIITLQVPHINYGGHLGNDSVLTLCHDARIQFFRSHSQSEKNLFGPGIIQADAAVSYKSEAFLGDEITINIFAKISSEKGFDLYYHLKNSKDVEVARVKTGLVCFSYEDRKLKNLPTELKKIIE